MGLDLLLPLVVLALVDSTSFGTLLIPLWLMLAPGRVRAARVVVFLATVAGFYLLLGVALAAGAVTFLDAVGAALETEAGRVVRLVVGAVLVVLGLTVEPWTREGKRRKAERRAARETVRGPGRLTRWRARAAGDEGSTASVMALAVSAAGLEALSMVPYLAAVGLLVTSPLTGPQVALVLAGYCLVMVLPALLLLGARLALHERLTRRLQRLEAYLTRTAGETLAWVLFLLGVFLLSDAAS